MCVLACRSRSTSMTVIGCFFIFRSSPSIMPSFRMMPDQHYLHIITSNSHSDKADIRHTVVTSCMLCVRLVMYAVKLMQQFADWHQYFLLISVSVNRWKLLLHTLQLLCIVNMWHLQTIFYFDIQSNFFKEALDRFAQFFINPLFKPECMRNEAEIVDRGLYFLKRPH